MHKTFSFINTLDSARSWLPGNFDIQPDTVRILLRAGLSKAILTNIYSQSGYWAKMGNQRHVCYDTDENLKTFGKNSHWLSMQRLIDFLKKYVTNTAAGGIQV